MLSPATCSMESAVVGRGIALLVLAAKVQDKRSCVVRAGVKQKQARQRELLKTERASARSRERLRKGGAGLGHALQLLR